MLRWVLFFAPWNGTSHVLEPLVPEIFERCDVSKDPAFAEEYGVTTVPIFLAIDEEGLVLDRHKTTSIPELRFWMQGVMNGRVNDRKNQA
jgi:hypothetical protein